MAVRTKANDECYLEVDAGAGVPAEILIGLGLPPELGRGHHELKIFTCSHCQNPILVNPWRTRERAWCRKCDHYICDGCGAELHRTGLCKPFRFIVHEIAEAADKGLSPRSVDIPTILIP